MFKPRRLYCATLSNVSVQGCPCLTANNRSDPVCTGFGYADVENRVECRPDTVMRIASISKSQTMTIVARLMEQGKLDIDKPVESYVPSWPRKMFNGKPVSEDVSNTH